MIPMDKTLSCRDCGQSFLFTEGEQEFFASRGFSNEPSRWLVSPVKSTPSNSGAACAVRMVTCRAGPPMFIRVMTRTSLGGAVVGKNPPQSLREADRGSVSDRLLGEQDVG